MNQFVHHNTISFTRKYDLVKHQRMILESLRFSVRFLDFHATGLTIDFVVLWPTSCLREYKKYDFKIGLRSAVKYHEVTFLV